MVLFGFNKILHPSSIPLYLLTISTQQTSESYNIIKHAYEKTAHRDSLISFKVSVFKWLKWYLCSHIKQDTFLVSVEPYRFDSDVVYMRNGKSAWRFRCTTNTKAVYLFARRREDFPAQTHTRTYSYSLIFCLNIVSNTDGSSDRRSEVFVVNNSLFGIEFKWVNVAPFPLNVRFVWVINAV